MVIIERKIGDLRIPLEHDDRNFEPNPVTGYLASVGNVVPGSSVLEIGGGECPLGIYSAKKGAKRVGSSDIMQSACDIAERNVKLNGVEDIVRIRCGSLFDPWKGETFDLIFNDAAGMIQTLGRKTKAYKNPQIPTGGELGTENSLAVIEQAEQYLNPGGRLILPVISFSDYKTIISAAERKYKGRIREVLSKLIPLCEEEFKAIKSDLERLADERIVSYIQKGSRCLLNLWIYEIRAKEA